jgi:DNA polymerase-1
MNNQTLIVDISHLIYRNASVSGTDLYTSDNLPVKALYGVLSSINHVITENTGINKIYLAFDGKPVWRKALYPDYKGNRESNPDNPRYQAYITPNEHGWSRKDMLSWTINKVKEIAPTFAMHVVYDEEAEGDDIAYRLAKKLYDHENLIFMTDDKDWLQLINLFPNATIYRAMAEEYITKNNFQETQNLPANWFIFQKTMLGDKSDNIGPVIDGCGEKAIEFLINEAIKNNINPNSDTILSDLYPIICEKSTKNELGRYKKLININTSESYEKYGRNKQLVDFRYCPQKELITEKLNEISQLDFEAAGTIIQQLEFQSLAKIIVPGSPWYKLS